MPELPEVETVRRQLDARIRGKTIQSFKLLQSGREFPLGEKFIQRILGKKIQSVDRRAKLLVWRFEDGEALTAHLKMTGRFVFVDDGYVPGKHDRAIFEFNDVRLVWSDIRKFGFLKLVDAEELSSILSEYGPEPLEASVEELADRFIQPKTRLVKAALLNQEVIAGVGNIYADEALHRAGILPTRKLGDMTAKERLRLAEELKRILSDAVAQKGTSANDYVDTQGDKGGFLSFLRVYGRKGEACRNCLTAIEKVVLNQRGTHFCPKCQK